MLSEENVKAKPTFVPTIRFRRLDESSLFYLPDWKLKL